MSASLREGGRGRGAHRECIGGLGVLGEGPEPTNRATATGRSEEGKNVGAALRGLLEGRGSVRWVEDGVAELVG